jgi:hypothetical protein
MVFTRAFYTCLLSGHPVQQAFAIGKVAVLTCPHIANAVVECNKFVLLTAVHAHDTAVVDGGALTVTDSATSSLDLDNEADSNYGIIFSAEPLLRVSRFMTWPQRASHCVEPRSSGDDDGANSSLPRTVATFEGRQVDMHRVMAMLYSRPLVSITGVPGVGKSTLAVAAGNYMADRGMFSNGVLYLELVYSEHSPSGPFDQLLDAILISIYGASHEYTAMTTALKTDLVVSALRDAHVLVVLDNVDEFICHETKTFIEQILYHCPDVKMLVSCGDGLDMHKQSEYHGIVEQSVHIASLTLRSTLRLFAKLAPPLAVSAKAKTDFVNALLIAKHIDSTMESACMTPKLAKTFEAVGFGHPRTIIQLACAATSESIREIICRINDESFKSVASAVASAAAVVNGVAPQAVKSAVAVAAISSQVATSSSASVGNTALA